MANSSPFRISDGSRTAPLPPVVPAQRLPLPSSEDADGLEHSPTIRWPAADNGPQKPYKSLR